MSEPNFELRIVFRANVLASAEKAGAFVDVLRTRGGDLAPSRFSTLDEPEAPLELDAVVAAIERTRKPPDVWLANDLGVSSRLGADGKGRDPGSYLFVEIPQRLVHGRGDQVLHLDLRGNHLRSIDPADLPRTLRVLDIAKNHLSEAEIAKVQAALPECDVYYYGQEL